MLFFRSEDEIDAWCEAEKNPRRPTVTLDQLWRLAMAWYENRLSPDARRPKPDEMGAIFARIGLTGWFWNPSGDRF